MATEDSDDFALLTRLADEFAARYRAGERPSLSEYCRRHPALAAEIRDLFPAMAEIEQAKEDHRELAAPPAASPAPVLKQLGDFRILREIGKGGMGVVYEAEQISLGRHVALKVLPRKMLLDAKAKSRFEREFKVAAKLHHTNIVPVFGVGVHEDLPYYAMQFIQGLGLDDVLEELKLLQRDGSATTGAGVSSRVAQNPHPSSLTSAFRGTIDFNVAANPPVGEATPETCVSGRPHAIGASAVEAISSVALPRLSGSGEKSRKWAFWRSVAQVGVQVADALEYAHQQGVLHRDIKPSNLLLDNRGTVWVTDFGLAKADDQRDLTHTGDILGTLRYMPPEAFEGKFDSRADVYSLGLTLYELLALQPAFVEADRARLIKQLTTAAAPPLDRINAAIPRDLVTIIHKSVERDPAARYQTAADLAADLKHFIADEPIKARRTSSMERLWRWSRHNRGLAASLAAILFLLIVVAVGTSVAALWSAKLAADAERAGDEARRRGDAERWERYRANIAAAASALQINNVTSARAALDATPVEHRNWEWLHLFHQLDLARLVLRGRDKPDAKPDAKPAYVWAVAFDPSSKLLASAADGGFIHLWNTESGKRIAALGGHKGKLAFLQFSPEGKRLVCAGYDDNTLSVWDVAKSLANGKSVVRHRLADAAVATLAFSPDLRYAAAGLKSSRAGIWDVDTGKQVALLPGEVYYPAAATCFSPDGRLLAYSLADNSIHLWDMAAAKDTAVLRGHSYLAMALAFSPDGKRLVSGSAYPDNTARLWNTATGEAIAVLAGHRNQVNAVAFSADGARIATGSMDQQVRLWDGHTGKLLRTCVGHTGYVWKVLFTPDGKHMVSSSEDETLRLWRADTGEPVAVLRGHSGPVIPVAFSPDGAMLASGSKDQSVRVWDLAHEKRSGVLRGHTDYVYDVAFSPDGSQVASASWDGTARLWDTETGRQTALWKHADGEIVTSVTFSHDGKQGAVTTRAKSRRKKAQGEIVLWDVARAARRPALPILSGAWDLDARTAFHPTRPLLATGSRDGLVHLWDTAKNVAVAELHGHEGGSGDVAFRPDVAQLASTGKDGTVRIWDVDKHTELAVLRGHGGGVRRVKYSADGRLLASTGNDRTVRIWDAQTYAELAKLPHGSVAYGIAFSPDGSRLAAGCADNTIRLWDLATNTEVAELRGHEEYVHAVAFSPDGTRLVSGSGDFTVRIWDTVAAQVRARPKGAYLPPRHYLCHRAIGPITVDGRLDEDAWKAVPWTEDFVDIEDGLRIAPRFRTRAKMLWDDKYFYVAAHLEEPHIWGTLTKHDSVIFQDNDFEVFIDPDGDNHNYAEFEINALNTGWDLRLPKPYRDGGDADNGWEIPGLKTAVHIDGTLNDPRDIDKGWTVEIAFPWEVLGKLTKQAAPPRDGDHWRVNFSRVEWRHQIVNGKYEKVPHRREDNWVWTPQWAVNMHMPEMWGYVRFATAAPGAAVFRPDPAGPAKHVLHRIYHAQRVFHKQHGRFAGTLSELGLAGLGHDSLTGPPALELRPEGYQVTAEVRLANGRVQRWRIREDSLVEAVK